jgi:hypothetical protein
MIGTSDHGFAPGGIQPSWDSQATANGEHSFVAGDARYTTVCSSSWSTGDRKDWESYTTGIEGGGDVVTHHTALGRVWQPGQGHGASNVGI